MSQVHTSAIPFVETEHGRLRRKQRGIDKRDLQAALKYGTRQGGRRRPNGDSTSKYTYKDIVYIVNDRTSEEVTSYAVPIQLDVVPINSDMEMKHTTARKKLQADLHSWTSNTVIAVDRSGSMRTSDMWGCKNRLGSVWISVALDFLAQRLESGDACETDIISIVTIEQEPDIVVKEEPCSWVLYNKLVSLYNDEEILPYGHGPFLPCLETAEELLLRNSYASCAMALCFLSDGRPSDANFGKKIRKERYDELIVERVGALARRFGRRLTFTAIGIGDADDFAILENMVDAAKDYGAIATFQLPSMTSSALGGVFTSVATALTTTQVEMTDAATLKQRRVREVERESRKKARQSHVHVSTRDFWIYPKARVKRKVYMEWFEDRELVKKYKETQLQQSDAQYVAMCKEAFGEGAERIVFRFFELGEDGRTIVGPPLVAKESRLILDDDGVGDEKARNEFVRTFCSTQQLARRIAEEFNEKLAVTRRVDRATPRITFLDCSVYQLKDDDLGELSVLVEEKLDHDKWFKWNANNGFVEGMNGIPVISEVSIRETMAKMAQHDLTVVAENREEEEEEESDDEAGAPRKEPICFTPSEVAQAFSHFSYWATGRKRLICDLQGVFDDKENVLKLSDPVIHYHHSGRSDRRFVHGRTDRGRRGMALFFETHHEHCGHLCKLVNRGFRRPRYRHNAPSGTHSK